MLRIRRLEYILAVIVTGDARPWVGQRTQPLGAGEVHEPPPGGVTGRSVANRYYSQ